MIIGTVNKNEVRYKIRNMVTECGWHVNRVWSEKALWTWPTIQQSPQVAVWGMKVSGEERVANAKDSQ